MAKIKALREHFVSYHRYISSKEEIREESEGYFGDFIDLIDIPFYYMRKFTIIPGDPERYDHFYTIYWAILGIPFIFVNFIPL